MTARKSRCSALLLIFSLLLVSCADNRVDSHESAFDTQLPASDQVIATNNGSQFNYKANLDIKQAIKLPPQTNPFVTVPRVTAQEAISHTQEAVRWSGTAAEALFAVAATGKNLADSDKHWRCSTKAVDGVIENVSVRLLEDANGFVDNLPITWYVSGSDHLAIIAPGKGTIRWKKIRFSINDEWPMQMFAEDTKGETADCFRIRI